MEYALVNISTYGENVQHAVNVDGVVRIYVDGWSTEPHCGVEVVRVEWRDGRKKTYNLAYMPSVELFPTTQQPTEQK